MCDWCAPTERSVVEVPPVVSVGGALIAASPTIGVAVRSPWQSLHGWSLMTSTVPFMCSCGYVIVVFTPGVIVGWHMPQFVSCGCVPPLFGSVVGGMPWHA